MRRMLCLHMPYLPTERARRKGAWADDHRRPLVLTRPVGASLVVAQACPRARELGLRPGLSLGQAQAMAPALAALTHEPQRDRAALERLARWALRFSPLVEPVEPDTLLLDITGCQLLFRGEENIARQALAGLERLGFHARAAIADTIGAAYALAAAGRERFTIVPVGQASAYLAPLPVATLRIDSQVAERLDLLGIRSIGDLLMLPRASLPARFGPQLVLRLRQALGEAYEGVTPRLPDEVPLAGLHFENPVTEIRIITDTSERLLTKVFEQLRRRELALRRVELILYHEHAPPRLVSIGLSRASRTQPHVSKLLVERLERVDPAPGVTGLMLVAKETSRWRAGQGGLFEQPQPQEAEALGGLIDRLVGRLGGGAVLRPQLVDDHQPEMAFRYASVVDVGCEDEGFRVSAAGCQGRTGRRESTGLLRPVQSPAATFPGRTPVSAGQARLTEAGDRQADAGLGAPGLIAGLGGPALQVWRPARLLARPVPIRVMALTKTPDSEARRYCLPLAAARALSCANGPPAWLAYRGREYVVVHAAGPERLETGWWRGPDVRRDYFRVSVDTGEQFWIFRDLVAGRWYLHGVFA